MTTRFDDKEPSGEVTVQFDFGPEIIDVSSAAVTIAVYAGVDPDVASMLIGTPTVIGAKVLQRVRHGLAGVDYALECFADATGGRLSIGAILPVRDRPIASSAVPRYCTEAQFEARFGEREYADLLSSGHAYAQAENDAASMIDGYMASRYTLPLASVPGIVTGWAADITRFKLWDQRAPEEVRKRYEDAISQLRDLAAGRLSLPPDAAGVPVAAGVAFDGYAACRVFSADTLAGF
jgi:phage gp36-like protein